MFPLQSKLLCKYSLYLIKRMPWAPLKVVSPLLVLRLSSSHLPAVLLDPAHNKGLNIGHPPPSPSQQRHPGELCGTGNEFRLIIIISPSPGGSRTSPALRGDPSTLNSLPATLTHLRFSSWETGKTPQMPFDFLFYSSISDVILRLASSKSSPRRLALD